MIEKMKQCKFLLMLLMLFIGMGAYAQPRLSLWQETTKVQTANLALLLHLTR